jgi:hypothetical protein
MAVGNSGQIVQFNAPTGSGSVAVTPSNTITSSALQGAIPGLAYDSAGNLYAVTYNPLTGGGAAVVVFGVGAGANATPTRVIAGTAGVPNNTTLGAPTTGGGGGNADPQAIAVDAKGNIYVAEFPLGGNNAPSIVVFATGANGNVAPTQLIQGSNTGLPATAGIMTGMDIAVDAGQNIYVVYSTPSASGILKFTAGSTGNVAPATSLTQASSPSLSGTSGIAMDVNLNTYVTNQATSSLQFYGAAASSTTPLSTVSGFNTTISNPLAVRFGP